LALIFALSLQSDDILADGIHQAHRYAAAEPSWTQLALPRLGTPLMPGTSITGLVTAAAQPSADGSAFRLSTIALIAQVVTLLLFFAVAQHMRVPASVAAVTIVALGLEPGFFAASTAWTPYLALPPLVLGAVLARMRWHESGDARWLAAIGVLLAAAVAESIYAIALMIPLLTGLEVSRRQQTSQRRWLIAATIVALVAGISLQVLGAASAWRSVSAYGAAALPSWRDALVAATSRWGRLAEIYLRSSIPEIAHRLRENVVSIGLFAPMLAAFGLFSLFQANRRSLVFFAGMLLAIAAIDTGFVAPVSSLSAAQVLFPVIVYLLAARGIAALLESVTYPAVALVCCGVVLAGDGIATRRISAMDRTAVAAADRERRPLLPFRQDAALVASDADADRRWDYAAHVARDGPRVLRIPQTYTAIRQASDRQLLVAVRANDAPRVATMGWMLTSMNRNAPSSDLVEVIEPTACVDVDSNASVDLKEPIQAGSIGLQADRDSAYRLDLEIDGLSAMPTAKELIADEPLVVRRRDSTHLGLAVAKGREWLPRIDFDAPPGRIRAQLASDDPNQRVRVCGAPARGQAIRWAAGDAAVAIPIDDRTIFETGWHPAEPVSAGVSQRWSNGTTGTAVLQIPGVPVSIEVTVDARAAVSADRHPTLTLAVNGRRLSAQTMTPGVSRFSWTVPREIVRRGLNVFRLEVPEAVSPHALGVSEDERQLGFAVSGFRLQRLP
jgi:hypothetical protein